MRDMTLVKMCGLMSLQDIGHANEVLPDFAGMIMAPGFRRSISEDTAFDMVSALNEKIQSVGVFMDQHISDVIRSADTVGFDYIQLHGKEDDFVVTSLQDELGLPIIKRFGVTPEEIECAKSSSADIILFDPGCGSGETFDTSSLNDICLEFFLAGGLTPENVGAAIRSIHPYGVDTSSGIEADGIKDKDKMRLFIRAVREADKEERE